VPTRQLSLIAAASAEIRVALAALRVELGLPAMFPPDVLTEAQEAAERDLWSCPNVGEAREDRRDIELVTIDPPGSMDLDQAVYVTAVRGGGYVVHYAIADLAAFVAPGGALDAEVNQRGLTVYGPDVRTPLHPGVLSEDAASLLPGQDRPAALWTIHLDTTGEIIEARVTRAMVRSRQRLTYAEAQSALDDGTASELLRTLADVGRLRQARERDRGGVSLDVPEQEVSEAEDGTFKLEFRATLPIEGWNAQISLLTGIAAAKIMREAGIGIFRTLPPADPLDLRRLRHIAHALDINWPKSLPYPELLARLDSRIPKHAAFLAQATTLFRGASYLPFDTPADPLRHLAGSVSHSAIAADYAHVTAPLRRLVDRYGTEICLAHCAGRSVPAWVTDALGALPTTMATAGRLASSFERACIDIVEAALLAPAVGDQFDGVVVEADTRSQAPPYRGEVVLNEPAVRARLDGAEPLPLGEPVTVTLTEASVPARRIRFTLP